MHATLPSGGIDDVHEQEENEELAKQLVDIEHAAEIARGEAVRNHARARESHFELFCPCGIDG